MNKRFFGFSLFMGVMFCLTSALGIWQLQRLNWKETLISQFEQAEQQPPIQVKTIKDLQAVPEDFHDGARVQFEAIIDSAREIHAYAIFYPTGNPKQPQPGYWIISPAQLTDGSNIIISRGMILDSMKAQTPQFAAPKTIQKLVGVMRKTEAGNFATPAPDLAKNVWFARDTSAMSAYFKLPTVQSFYIQLTEGDKNVWPQPQKLNVIITNNHLGYALTWFGLAFVIAMGYMVVARKTNSPHPRA